MGRLGAHWGSGRILALGRTDSAHLRLLVRQRDAFQVQSKVARKRNGPGVRAGSRRGRVASLKVP